MSQTTGQIVFPEKANWGQKIQDQVSDCIKARRLSVNDFTREVESLCDLMVAFWDNEFEKNMDDLEIPINTSNPYSSLESMTKEDKETATRAVFRSVNKLIQRSGFLAEKTIEGILDERTIDTIIGTITKSAE